MCACGDLEARDEMFDYLSLETARLPFGVTFHDERNALIYAEMVQGARKTTERQRDRMVRMWRPRMDSPRVVFRGPSGSAHSRIMVAATEHDLTRWASGFVGLPGYISASEGERRDERDPTVTPCENAGCGPDITDVLINTLLSVRRKYLFWGLDEKEDQCAHVGSLLHLKNAVDGWDIPKLYFQKKKPWGGEQDRWSSSVWLDDLPCPCCFPRKPDDENFGCGRTVAVSVVGDEGRRSENRQSCFMAGSVNYALLGVICQLCTTSGWKGLGFERMKTIVNVWSGWDGTAEGWASAGWNWCGSVNADHPKGLLLPPWPNRPKCPVGLCPPWDARVEWQWIWAPRENERQWW